MTHSLTPNATYRLQLHAGFPFAAAQEILPYLADLGVSTVYLSPVWTSTPGSTHGYDVTDHAEINPELGGLAGLRALSARAHELGLDLIADFVPNHMGIRGGHNAYWEDVLRHGQASRYAHFFDIEWEPLKRGMQGKVLLPILGQPYGEILKSGELRLNWEPESGELFLNYWERRLPLAPRSVGRLLRQALEHAPAEAQTELGSVARSLAGLPSGLTDEEKAAQAQETELAGKRLRTLLGESAAVSEGLSRVAEAVNADPQQLHALLEEQYYRLAWWKVAAEEINYRRFFDVNDLAALRMEDPSVFAWAHALLLELVREGVLRGVRLDHTDGLYDPAAYFAALREQLQEAAGGKPVYIVAEKILEPHEALPRTWAIEGTTGYDFLVQLGGVWIRAENEAALTKLYQEFTGDILSYPEHLHAGKHLIQRLSLAGEVNVLTEHLERLSEHDLKARDYTLSTIRQAIREIIACFPVYRSYVRPDGSREADDNARIAEAVTQAKAHNGEVPPALFDYLQEVLTLGASDPERRAAHARFALSFQQLTGPITAKGAEDTAFYRYSRLLPLCEVGGDPAHFGLALPDFHAAMVQRAQDWPHAMLTLSTHDTKRGEDLRARLSVLSEMPEVWRAFLNENEKHLQAARTADAPSSPDLYLLVQSLLGVYPLAGHLDGLEDRVRGMLLKSAREAKARTSWIAPDEAYEAALDEAVRRLFANAEFMASLGALHERLSPYGAQNGLSATLVKLTAPGVPDTYQGSESWNQDLVDPDNRRPVDYAHLAEQLAQVGGRGSEQAQAQLADYRTGAVKLLVTHAALQARRAQPQLWLDGSYRPLDGGAHLVAFAREWEGQRAVTVAPRLTWTLTGGQTPWAVGEVWGEQRLECPDGDYLNVLTGERVTVSGGSVRVADLLGTFPLALLVSSA